MSADDELFLIGCGGPAPSPAPSAERMGFKAWNLARMAALGLPVPPAFVLGTAWCADPERRRRASLPATWALGLQALQAGLASPLQFGDARRPLLLSVRSGAPVSMPGMMETLLNIGLCDATVPGLLRLTGQPRLVWDAYRRLVASYGEVVAGLDAALFEAPAASLGAPRDERDLDFAELRELTRQHLKAFAQAAGRPFPQDPGQQLAEAIAAVLASWQAPKAVEYRRLHRLPDTLGTAVTVQAMVFGNAGGRSGAGVGFTRDPSSGEPEPWVDFLFNAQGEDVVSGRRSAQGHEALANVLPDCWAQLVLATHTLEQQLGDMQDFEFTVQEGTLYLLQTRSGKRSAYATARIALDMLDQGLISAEEALRRTAGLGPEQLSQRRVLAAIGQALAPAALAASASPGVVSGALALDEAAARSLVAQGRPVVLVRRDAETSDIATLELAGGLLTQRGARTSHAAVVARQMGKVCLVGCETLQIDLAARRIQLGPLTLHEGDTLSLDGHQGQVYAGAVQTRDELPQALLQRLDTLRGAGKPGAGG